MGEQVERLEHHPDLAPDRIQRAQIVTQFRAIDDDLAFLMRLQPVDAADHRRLAGPRGAADDNAFLLLRTRDAKTASEKAIAYNLSSESAADSQNAHCNNQRPNFFASADIGQLTRDPATGILTPGPLEVLPLNAIRHEFEVNVFGALAVVNSFLPALRKARGRIVQVSTMTATLPFPFNGPSGASKAAFDALAAVYRAELKPFGVDVVLAVAGNMKTGGPAKTAAALKRVADQMTPEQRELYGKAFDTFAKTLNNMQGSGLDSVSAANRVIELSEQVPAPSRGAVGADAEEVLRLVREKSDAEQNAMRLHMVGLE